MRNLTHIKIKKTFILTILKSKGNFLLVATNKGDIKATDIKPNPQ